MAAPMFHSIKESICVRGDSERQNVETTVYVNDLNAYLKAHYYIYQVHYRMHYSSLVHYHIIYATQNFLIVWNT